MTPHDPLPDALTRAARKIGVSPVPEFKVETPRDPAHGDRATNLALLIAKPLKIPPRRAGELLIEALDLPPGYIKKTEIAGPGFINFWIAEAALTRVLGDILAAGARYGRSETGAGRSVNVEFVSANPTGPLHVGHGRGAALGDAIAALLEWTGHAVTREFYVNDAGTQIDKLARSLWARIQEQVGRSATIPEGGYQGEYLVELARALLEREGPALADLPGEAGVARCRDLAIAAERAEQDRDLREFGVAFDCVTSETEMYREGWIDRTLRDLAQRGQTFEADGALWLRASALGDEKDRVLRKSDGTYTYLLPDIAYHRHKHERGFARAIDIWGADHHGYVARMRAAMRALGYPDDFFHAELVQLVRVMRGGEEVRFSKRTGDIVTLRELFEETGVDAARYFFLMRRGDSQFVFDVDLARSRTEENPVFYVQMAHARMSGIFRVAARDPEQVLAEAVDLSVLSAPEETDLLNELAAFPRMLARAAETFEPHRITGYLESLARIAHAWYHKYRVLGEPEEHARLVLARAVRQVLANGLTLLGIQAPDRM
ncbi:MAG TPA: arginine--tRNA ligase [Gemmatimonadales bacterium]|nr:arginine--tRNA ligase [Gemmatimonadales bacterium]